jgi:hypothetical protein
VLSTIVRNLWNGVNSPAKAITSVGVAGSMTLEMVAGAHAMTDFTPARLAAYAGMAAIDYFIIYGVGQAGDAIHDWRDKKEERQREAALWRHTPLRARRSLGAVAAKALVGIAALGAVALGGYGVYRFGEWFLSRRQVDDIGVEYEDSDEPSGSSGPSSSAIMPAVPASEMKPWNMTPQEACKYVYEPEENRVSVGCFDLQHGLRYPVHPWAYTWNAAHRDQFNSQDIACFVDGLTSTHWSDLQGNPVYSPLVSGTVVAMGENAEHGKGIAVEGKTATGESVRVYLGHLRDFGQVTKGDSIDENTVLGYCGRTGLTPEKGSHLHFQADLIVDGDKVPFNPFVGETYGPRIPYKLKTRPSRTPQMRYDFAEHRKRYNTMNPRMEWNPASRGR